MDYRGPVPEAAQRLLEAKQRVQLEYTSKNISNGLADISNRLADPPSLASSPSKQPRQETYSYPSPPSTSYTPKHRSSLSQSIQVVPSRVNGCSDKSGIDVEDDADDFGDFAVASTSSNLTNAHNAGLGLDAAFTSIAFDSDDHSASLNRSASGKGSTQPVLQPTLQPNAKRKEEDLLMLFEDDEAEDIGLASASPAKLKTGSAFPSTTAKNHLQTDSSLTNGHHVPALSLPSASPAAYNKHRASPCPSRDLFRAYYEALLPYFKSLQSHTTNSLIFTHPTLLPLARAQLLSTLNRLANIPAISPTRIQTVLTVVRRNLQSSTDYFEAAMLAQFERAADGNLQRDMRETTAALWELNGGTSVVQVFINKIPLFYDQSWDPLLNLTKTITPYGDEVDAIDFTAMDRFMAHVLAIVHREGTVIALVFPADTDVLVTFAERIAIDVLSEYIVPLLSAAQDLEAPLFLLTTAACFGQAMRLVDTVVAIKPQSRAVTRDKVEKVILNMFQQHMNAYLKEEGKWAREMLTGICEEWDKKLAQNSGQADPHFLASQNVQQVKRNVLAGFTKALLLPVTIVPKTVAIGVSAITYGGSMALSAMSGGLVGGYHSSNSSVSKPVVAAAAADNFDTPDSARTPASGSLSSFTSMGEGNGFGMLLSLDTAMQLIQSDRDCLKRIQTFSGYTGAYGQKVKHAIEEVFIILCQTLAEQHLRPAFTKLVTLATERQTILKSLSQHYRATTEMETYRPADHDVDESVTPLVQFFELVHLGDTIAQMLQVYYDREMARYVDKNDFLSIVVREKKKFENTLDDSVASGLNAGVSILMEQAEHILRTQQDIRDFAPDLPLAHSAKSGFLQTSMAVVDIEGPSKAAQAVVECLRTHCDMLKGSTDKAILDIFHQEVGLRLHGILLKHLKRSIVSIPGGFQVIADLNLYTSFVSSLKLPNVNPYFTALKMAANVFIIDSPQDLGMMARDLDRYEGTLRIEDIMEMVQCRTDWKKIERLVEKEVFGFKAEDCRIM